MRRGLSPPRLIVAHWDPNSMGKSSELQIFFWQNLLFMLFLSTMIILLLFPCQNQIIFRKLFLQFLQYWKLGIILGAGCIIQWVWGEPNRGGETRRCSHLWEPQWQVLREAGTGCDHPRRKAGERCEDGTQVEWQCASRICRSSEYIDHRFWTFSSHNCNFNYK